jgi:hypothetical protein
MSANHRALQHPLFSFTIFLIMFDGEVKMDREEDEKE